MKLYIQKCGYCGVMNYRFSFACLKAFFTFLWGSRTLRMYKEMFFKPILKCCYLYTVGIYW